MLYETLRQALKAIMRNAMRSFLTVLGIIIGVAAVIALVTLGQGSTSQVEADVSKLGTNLLILRPGRGFGPGREVASAPPFAARDIEAIETQIPSVLTAAPAASKSMTIVYGNDNESSTVTGTDSRFLVARDWELTNGREFYESETRSGAAVCILGETIRSKLFGTGDPVDEVVRIEQISCRVIGVLEAKGASSFGSDQDDVVLMPLRTFQRRIAGNQDISQAQIAVRNNVSTSKAKAAIELLMRERRRIRAGEDDNFMVMDTKELSSMLTGVMTGMLSTVAAVSLLVGGIGIMNIMLVSVTERTREIGIRLAIGATEGQVLMQFLVEAIVLSLFGGLLGIALGLALAGIGSSFLRVPFSPDPLVVVAAFAFSALIGIVFGFFPARRAARLDPIEALRHE
jgi:putative ABC transport system permease protein